MKQPEEGGSLEATGNRIIPQEKEEREI